VAVTGLAEAGCDLREARVIIGGSLRRREFALDAEDVSGGDGDGIEEGFAGHAVVALLIVRRDATLIAEGDLDAIPVQIAGGAGPEAIDRRGVRPPDSAMRKRPRAAIASRAAVRMRGGGVFNEGGGVEDFGSHGVCGVLAFNFGIWDVT